MKFVTDNKLLGDEIWKTNSCTSKHKCKSIPRTS